MQEAKFHIFMSLEAHFECSFTKNILFSIKKAVLED